MSRRFLPDQTHQRADENALRAVRDTLKILSNTDDSLEVKQKRALEILRGLHRERSQNVDSAFILDDALRILLSPPR